MCVCVFVVRVCCVCVCVCCVCVVCVVCVLCVCVVCVCVCVCVCAQEFLPPGEEALYLVGSCHNKSIFERYVLRSDLYPVNKSGATINGFTVCVRERG